MNFIPTKLSTIMAYIAWSGSLNLTLSMMFPVTTDTNKQHNILVIPPYNACQK